MAMEGSEIKFSRRQLVLRATLSESDHAEVRRCRGGHCRLGFAYQLGFVKLLGRLPNQYSLEVIPELVTFMAIQIGEDETALGDYQRRRERSEPFVFDNEKWAHPVDVAPFRISRTQVTNAEFAEFVDAGGYNRSDHWGYQGWLWRGRVGLEHPLYWRRDSSRWAHNKFGHLVPLEPNHAVCNVSWYEALAYCSWAGRRLPTEAEWDMAAAGHPNGGPKRRFPWGDSGGDTTIANLDGLRGGTVDARAFPAGDSAFGCRQMLGNTWEWTSTPHYPLPGYIVDKPYAEYSAPWFGYPKILRGAGWATSSRIARNGDRNFFTPDRTDVMAGFRTCAL